MVAEQQLYALDASARSRAVVSWSRDGAYGGNDQREVRTVRQVLVVGASGDWAETSIQLNDSRKGVIGHFDIGATRADF